MHPVVSISTPGRTTIHLVVSERVELGRDCGGLIVVDPAVSRRHVSIEAAAPSQVIVTDLGSTNGVQMGGERIGSPVMLSVGDDVVFGDTTLRVEAFEARPTATGGPASGARTATRETTLPTTPVSANDALRGTTIEQRPVGDEGTPGPADH